MELNEFMNKYGPRKIKLNGKVPAGICTSNTLKGEKVNIAQKYFTSSNRNDFFSTINIIDAFIDENFKEHKLNNLLIIIKDDEEALVYKEFPLTMLSRINPINPKKKGDPIFRNEILDIERVKFENDQYGIEINNGIKIIILFRINWLFGLYFDLSGELKKDELEIELANCFRYTFYSDIYRFVTSSAEYNQLLQQGWFPFIELVRNELLSPIISTLNECDERREKFIDNLINQYNIDKINKLTEKWWLNETLKKKKIILQAGLNSFLSNNKDGYINSIKTLSTEIEGILYIALSLDNEFNSQKKFREYIKQKGMQKFKSQTSLLFPSLFYDYLESNIFCKFTRYSHENQKGRHSIAHGNSNENAYTRERAFQFILTIDQIFYFIN